MKTFSPKPRHIERHWYVLNADGAVLGRLASQAAVLLRGKHKPIFAPHMDTGDHVIVVNARGVRLTGGKEEKKIYYRHSGYPGGIRALGYARLLAERPGTAVEKAVRGMLPKNRLGRQMFKKLAVYDGPDHPHSAQKPQALGLEEFPKWEGLPAPQPKPAPKAKAARERSQSTSPSRAPSGAKAAGGDAPTGKRGRAKSSGGDPTKEAGAGGKGASGRRTGGKGSTGKGTNGTDGSRQAARGRSARRSKATEESPSG